MHKKEVTSFDIALKNFRQHITNLNLKNTIQKDYILKVLYYSKKHLTADEIEAELLLKYNINISTTTVYKALKLLEKLNIISSLEVLESAKCYELNSNLPHGHLICTVCHSIIEFKDNSIDNIQLKIANTHAFTLTNQVMTIYGYCQKCQT
ncbi:MAG: transcriptional repressor [Arcobacter sp.]|uniref:Fur family transcriptional regulator n=1 Tax=uncultured Arcobacter sp. TaxID=165434 RepID=UPI000CC9D28C|nr:transcriptional repressor [uncultured Arcobacter sp.]PLY08529.1 MAG: transcriptional repressor [Arcobacter sp.]